MVEGSFALLLPLTLSLLVAPQGQSQDIRVSTETQGTRKMTVLAAHQRPAESRFCRFLTNTSFFFFFLGSRRVFLALLRTLSHAVDREPALCHVGRLR
jgi:hypothetical protein